MAYPLHFTPVESPVQSKCADISIFDDSVLEINETFAVVLSASSPTVDAARIITEPSAQAATVTIVNDDSVRVGFERESYTVDESDMEAVVCVILEGRLEVTVQVKVYTASNSAQGNFTSSS